MKGVFEKTFCAQDAPFGSKGGVVFVNNTEKYTENNRQKTIDIRLQILLAVFYKLRKCAKVFDKYLFTFFNLNGFVFE